MIETLTAYEELILFSVEFLIRIVAELQIELNQETPPYDYINESDN